MDLNPSVLVRPATEADLSEIVRIQSAAETASQWNPEDYLAQECLVAECDGRITGFVVARRISPDESEILNVAVAPEFRRQGIAKRLFAALHQGYYRNIESVVAELAGRGHSLYLGHERHDSAIGGQASELGR